VEAERRAEQQTEQQAEDQLGPEIEALEKIVVQAEVAQSMGSMKDAMMEMEPWGRQEVRPKMKAPVHLEPTLWTQIDSWYPWGKM
jgi:hypothetical protein